MDDELAAKLFAELEAMPPAEAVAKAMKYMRGGESDVPEATRIQYRALMLYQPFRQWVVDMRRAGYI